MSYIYDLADTWNNAATTFTSIKMNVTDTASNAASLLMDLQVGGVSQFRVRKDGIASMPGALWVTGASGVQVLNNGGIFVLGASQDTILSRRAAANLRLGAVDAAAPVAQTLSVQSVVAGTSNTAGADLTITGSQGTGTGTGGSIIFQVAPAGSSGTAQNALATALTIDSTGKIRAGLEGFEVSSNTGSLFQVQGTALIQRSGSTIQLALASYWQQLEFFTAGSTRLTINNAGTATFNGVVVANSGFASGANVLLTTNAGQLYFGSGNDVVLARDNSNILALRNGANAQTFRVYSTFTDTNNYERGALNAGADFIELAAETAGTGDDNLDVRLTPAGTGNVRFGTHTGTTDTAVSGYIEIKDAGGTIRKLAVIT